MSREEVQSTAHVKKIFIGAVREGIVEDDLRNYFGNYGRITDCIVMRDANGAHRGFAFVEFTDARAVDTIVAESQPHVIRGQTLDVKKAVPKPRSGAPLRGTGRGTPFVPFRGGTRGSGSQFRGGMSSAVSPYSSGGRTTGYYGAGGRDNSSVQDSYGGGARGYGNGYYGSSGGGYDGGRSGGRPSRGQYSRGGGYYPRGDSLGTRSSNSTIGPMRSSGGYGVDGRSGAYYQDSCSYESSSGDKDYVGGGGGGGRYSQQYNRYNDRYGSAALSQGFGGDYRQDYGFAPRRDESFKANSYSDYSGRFNSDRYPSSSRGGYRSSMQNVPYGDSLNHQNQHGDGT